MLKLFIFGWFFSRQSTRTTPHRRQMRSEEQSLAVWCQNVWCDLTETLKQHKKKKTARINDLCKRSYTGLFRQSVATLRVKNAASLEKWFQGSQGERSQQKQNPVEVDRKHGVKRQLTLKVIFSELNLTTDLTQSSIYKYLINVNQYPNSTWTVRENPF